MRVVVTGAAGFIGAEVTANLLRRGHDVHAAVRTGRPSPRLDHLGADIVRHETDLADAASVAAMLRVVAPEAAVHLAWYTEPGRYLVDPPRNLSSVAASAVLLEQLLAAGCQRLVLAGTCLEAPDRPGREPTYYAVAKRAVHALGARLGDGISVACAHVFSVYGPGEHESRAVPSIIRSLLAGDEIDVTRGSHLRDYLHVGDVADAMCTVLESGTVGTVDICSGRPRPIGDVFEEIGTCTGGGHLIRWGRRPVVAEEDFDVTGDFEVLAHLGWAPSRTLSAGIGETVAWWRSRLRPAGAAPGVGG